MNLKLSVMDQSPIHMNARVKLPLPDQAYFDETLSTMICDTPEYCRESLGQLASNYDVNEISVVNVTYDFEPRIRSYELLASGFEFAQTSTLNTGTMAV